MKQTTILLALALGVSAQTALGQPGEKKERQKQRPAEAREKALLDRKERRADEARPSRDEGPRQRMQRPGQFRPGPMWGGRGGFGVPQQRIAPGRPGFGPQGRGPAFGAPQDRPGVPGMCPACRRPLGRDVAPGRLGRDGAGPQGRGPAFGPPPWAGRGGPGSDLRSAPRGPGRDLPVRPGQGFGPMRRGPGGPEGQMDRPGPGPRPEGRGPWNRPPMERDNDRDVDRDDR